MKKKNLLRRIVSDIVIFVLKRDVKLQLTNSQEDGYLLKAKFHYAS